MTIAFNIPINIPQEAGARSISLAELKEKVQSYVNSLHITIRPAEVAADTLRKVNVSDRIKSLSAVPVSTSCADYKDDILGVLSSKY